MAAAVEADDDVVVVSTDRPTAMLAELTGWAVGRGIELAELAVSPPSLEDAYLRLIGNDGDEDDGDEDDGGGDDAG